MSNRKLAAWFAAIITVCGLEFAARVKYPELAVAEAEPCPGPKETPAQKEFLQKYAAGLEREGWRPTWLGVQGKDRDILSIDLPNVTVEAMYRFEASCVKPAAVAAAMRQAGFRSVRVYSGVKSASFPKGEMLISLEAGQ